MSAQWEQLWKDTREAAYKEAYNEVYNEAEQRGVLTTLFGLVDKGKLTLAEASEEASMPEAVFKEKMAEHHRA